MKTTSGLHRPEPIGRMRTRDGDYVDVYSQAQVDQLHDQGARLVGAFTQRINRTDMRTRSTRRSGPHSRFIPEPYRPTALEPEKDENGTPVLDGREPSPTRDARRAAKAADRKANPRSTRRQRLADLRAANPGQIITRSMVRADDRYRAGLRHVEPNG